MKYGDMNDIEWVTHEMENNQMLADRLIDPNAKWKLNGKDAQRGRMKIRESHLRDVEKYKQRLAELKNS